MSASTAVPVATAQALVSVSGLESWEEGFIRALMTASAAPNLRGFTLDSRLLIPPVCCVDDFVVSLAGFESRYLPPLTEQDARTWLSRARGALRHPRTAVGGWVSPQDDLLYLDVSIVVRGLGEAIRNGRENRQQSIYHPATHTTIWLVKKASSPLGDRASFGGRETDRRDVLVDVGILVESESQARHVGDAFHQEAVALLHDDGVEVVDSRAIVGTTATTGN